MGVCIRYYTEASWTSRRTPGGALKNRPKSVVHFKSGYSVCVKPHRVNLTLDSLAVVPGRTNEVNRTLSNVFGAEDCRGLEKTYLKESKTLTRLRGLVSDIMDIRELDEDVSSILRSITPTVNTVSF